VSASREAVLANQLRFIDGATAAEAALVVELSRPWWDEMRDSRGRWTAGGQGGVASIAPPKLNNLPAGAFHEAGTAHHQEIIKHVTAAATAQARAHTTAEIAKLRAEHEASMAKMMADVRKANQHAAKMAEDEKKAKRRRALALHTGTVVAGGVLAYFENKLGTPDIVTIASAIGPTIAHDLVDWSKRLSP
jgi:hypothetical protein